MTLGRLVTVPRSRARDEIRDASIDQLINLSVCLSVSDTNPTSEEYKQVSRVTLATLRSTTGY